MELAWLLKELAREGGPLLAAAVLKPAAEHNKSL